jgi:glycosyltransferase EpsD
MKILYVTTSSNTVNLFLIPHIKFLVEQGNTVDLAFRIYQEPSHELLKMGCKVHPIEFQRNPLNKKNLSAYKKIKRILIEEDYDIVHVHTPVASFVTRLAARNMKNATILYTAHGFHFFKGAPKINWGIYYPLEKLAAKWTDGIITMNQEDYLSACKLKLRKKNSVYKVSGVGLDLTKFLPQTTERKLHLRKEYGYHPDDFILIYVGELSYRKHQDLLIESTNQVKQQIPNLKILFVGDGDLEAEYQNMVHQLQLENHVEFLGFRHDVENLLTLSDLAISTSRQEGLPVNVMEAMATGIPLIVTDCRGNRDLVKNGENGLVVGVDDIQACAKAIEVLYHSETLRQAFTEKSKDIIRKYSTEDVINEMKQIYQSETIKRKKHRNSQKLQTIVSEQISEKR